MKLKNIAFAAVLATCIAPVLAADQTVDLSSGVGSFTGLALPANGILSGGTDLISFINLASGTYDFLLSVSAQNIAGLTASINGQIATITPLGKFSFASLESSAHTPFVLTLGGTANGKSIYSGELSVTAVPEPETYALLLAGLGVVGFVARRRRPQ